MCREHKIVREWKRIITYFFHWNDVGDFGNKSNVMCLKHKQHQLPLSCWKQMIYFVSVSETNFKITEL